MATGLAVLLTCLYTACGGGQGSEGSFALSFADAGVDDDSAVVVAAAGNVAMPVTAGGRKAASDVSPGKSRGDGPTPPPPSTTTTTSTPTTTTTTTPTTTTPPTTPTTTPTLNPLLVAVDISKIPPPGSGTSAFKVASTDEAAPPGAGAFRTVCTFSHMSFDDPIVFPGQPGRSHLHTFFGNTGANANSTPESLRGTGNSTCRGGIANRSSYWVPTLIDTRDNAPLKPDTFIVYYKTGKLPATSVQAIPTGLRMIAGNPNRATPRAARDTFDFRWTCKGPTQTFTSEIPGDCLVGSTVIQEIFFPQCWDGKNLDSPDHKSHMSYTVNVKNVNGARGWTHAECPTTHPVVLPQIAFNVSYTVREQGAPLRWRLASDVYDRSLPGGFSSHGDWFNGWKSDVSDAWAKSCIGAMKDCHAHLLGDGRKIF